MSWRLILALALVAGLGLQTWRLKQTEGELEETQAAYNQFRGATKALGDDQNRRVAIIDATNARNKERADEEHRRRTAVTAAAVSRLRGERDGLRASLFAANAAGSRCPDGLLCFDRAEYQRAHGAFVADLRAIADQCTAVETTLGVAAEWARRR